MHVMTILGSGPCMVLLVAALLLGTVAPWLKRYAALLPFAGGFCTTASIIWAFIAGATLQEILLAVLVIVFASSFSLEIREILRP